MDYEFDRVLAECLEDIQSGQSTIDECLEKYPQFQQELKSLLALAAYISDKSRINPGDEFIQIARHRLLAHISKSQPEVHQNYAPKPRRFFTPLPLRSRAVAFIAAVIIVVVALTSTGTVYASNTALPGDFLYPVKLTVENIRLGLSTNPEKVQLGIQYMSLRKQEIDQLISEGRYQDVVTAVSSLEQLSSHTVNEYQQTGNHLPDNLDQQGKNLGNSIDNNITVLNQVLEKVPSTAKPAIEHAIIESQKNRDDVKTKLHGVNSGILPTETETVTPSITPSLTDTPTPTDTITPTDISGPKPHGKKTNIPPGLSRGETPTPTDTSSVPPGPPGDPYPPAYPPGSSNQPSPPGLQPENFPPPFNHPSPSDHPGNGRGKS